MDCNKREAEARELTFSQFPTKFAWKKELRKWSLRERGFSIGMLQHVTPNCGELYFMRIMLNFVKGPTCYEDIRTVDRVVYPTYREACYTLGFLGDDKEMLLKKQAIGVPVSILEGFLQLCYYRILYQGRNSYGKQHGVYFRMKSCIVSVAFQTDQNYALYDIEASLQRNGSTLRRFDGMPFPDSLAAVNHVNTLLADELSYGKELLHEEHKQLISTMTDEQRSVYNEIMDAVPIDLSELLIRTKLIIWDEAPMTHKYCFEALDRSLRDIMRFLNNVDYDQPFGGKVIVFGGDFSTILTSCS
ncbi:uncharacterized protein LOC141607728 [Silene latifolia]|uniref:uncharacterized protein LOC141607728 n=1 Tax=Silene latifolia TaxID=37657 RepID=UPI003D774DE4